MYPILLEPIEKKYVWGSESWVIADREEGRSLVANGLYKGKTLHEILGKPFPLLFKIIDAQENLSVQVHPNEITAPFLQGEPKTEMWFMLSQGSVYAGLKKGVNGRKLLEEIAQHKAEGLLKKISVDPGDAIFIPGGRVHAICGGTKLFEVQQNSNTTYRLYDWGRTGRALHLKEGMAAINWDDDLDAKMIPKVVRKEEHCEISRLVQCPFFVVERMNVRDEIKLEAMPNSFQCFFCFEGECDIEVNGKRERLKNEGIVFVLAGWEIKIRGKCKLVRTFVL